MNRRTTGIGLLLAALALLLWRSRAASATGTATPLSPEVLDSYRDLISAFAPAGPTIVERSPIDAATDALYTTRALFDQYGWPYRMSVRTAEGGWTYERDMSGVPPAWSQFTHRGGNFVGTKPIRIIEP